MSRFTWATVTQVSPLRIQLDGDPAALLITPSSLVDTAALAVSDRVRVEMADNRVIVHGRYGGGPRLATNAETAAGLLTTPAVTPAGLKYAVLDRLDDLNLWCSLAMSAAQNVVGSGVNTPVNWDVERADPANMHSTVTNPSRITVPKAGRWRVTTHHLVLTTASYDFADIAVNGTQVASTLQAVPGTSQNNAGQYQTISLVLAANDYVQVRVSSASVVALGVANCFFQIEYIGP